MREFLAKNKTLSLIVLVCLIVVGAGVGRQIKTRFNARSGKVAADKKELDWNDLAQLDFQTGEAPADLKAYDNKEIKVPGFIVPLEDNRGETNEFLLVPDGMSCIHAPPPPPNQIVYVKMKPGKVVMNQWLPVWVVGTFHIAPKAQKFGTASFTMDGESSVLWQPPAGS